MIPDGTLLTGQYNLLTVVLSILIPVLGAYVALDLAAQVVTSKGGARRGWLVASTLAMAIAIWSMHYTAMLAFQLPVPVRYDVPIAVLCFCIAIFASAVSLHVATGKRLGWRLAIMAALFSGVAIVGLHYTSMASMRAAAMQHYHPLSIVLASAVSVVASLLSLRLIFRPREKSWAVKWEKAASALVMGAAISGMHYTAMAGTTFFAAAPHRFSQHTVDISPLGIAAIVVVTMIALVFMLLTGATVERIKYFSELKTVNQALRLENAERQRAEEELGRMSGQLLRAQDEERRRIARDLHDSTAQHLVLLSASLERIQHSAPAFSRKLRQLFSDAEELITQALREVRTLSYLLYPPMLDETGLEDAISHYVEGFSERSGVQVDVRVSPDLGRLRPEAEMALFRVMQESLTNVHLHSASRRAYIRLNRIDDRVVLEIRDEGRGTERAGSSRTPSVGVGILSMRERVRQVGGKLEIESTGAGTSVRATIVIHDKTP